MIRVLTNFPKRFQNCRYSKLYTTETWKHFCHIHIVHKACPSGSIRFKDKCYKLKIDDPLPLYDAREKCLRLGGDLISFGSEVEQTFVVKYLDRNGLSMDYWIGES